MDKNLKEIIPPDLQCEGLDDPNLYELVLDLGRPFQYRLQNFRSVVTEEIIQQRHLDYVLSRVPKIGPDGRVGIHGTLHRVSAVWGKNEEIIGFTIRMGRPFTGNISLIKDVLDSGLCVLIVGRAGAGKTTALRGVANYTSQNKRVIVVDKSSEIGGESNPPHPSIGNARRFQVPPFKDQSSTMLFALESHTPEVIIVDEISSFQEAMAAKTIAQRGVQLIATAHGRDLEDIVRNPPLVSLIGGVKTVTLSDEEAERRSTYKTIQERETKPTFDIVIEIISHIEVGIHSSVVDSVDAILMGGCAIPEMRSVNKEGKMYTTSQYRVSLPTPIQRSPQKDNKIRRKK